MAAEIEALRFACYPVFNFEFSRVLTGTHGLRPYAISITTPDSA